MPAPIVPAATPEGTVLPEPAAGPGTAAPADTTGAVAAPGAEDLLVAEVSIDGMCGVY